MTLNRVRSALGTATSAYGSSSIVTTILVASLALTMLASPAAAQNATNATSGNICTGASGLVSSVFTLVYSLGVVVSLATAMYHGGMMSRGSIEKRQKHRASAKWAGMVFLVFGSAGFLLDLVLDILPDFASTWTECINVLPF